MLKMSRQSVCSTSGQFNCGSVETGSGRVSAGDDIVVGTEEVFEGKWQARSGSQLGGLAEALNNGAIEARNLKEQEEFAAERALK